MLMTVAPMLAACTTARANVDSVPAFSCSASAPPERGLTGLKARDDCRIEMIVACGATPTTPSGAPGGGPGTAGGSSTWASAGPLDGSTGASSGGGAAAGGGGGGGGVSTVTVTGAGGGGGAGGAGTSTGGSGAEVTAGGAAGGANAGAAGNARGIGTRPCGAAAMIEAMTVPWASQSLRPSSPMT